MENLQINLQLPLQWVNLVLAGLAKLPFEQVNEPWNAVRAQAQAQVDAMNKAAQAPAAKPEAEAQA